MSPTRILLLITGTLLGLTACAPAVEQHAFDRWTQIDRTQYGGHNSPTINKHQMPKEIEAPQSLEPPGIPGVPGEAVSNSNAHANHTRHTSEISSLQEFLRYAAMHNPQLEAAFNAWKAALERVTQARFLPDPKFNYKFFIRCGK